MSLLLLFGGGGAAALPAGPAYPLLSKLSPYLRRIVQLDFWIWLEEQIELIKKELEGKVVVGHLDFSSTASLTGVVEQTLKSFVFSRGVFATSPNKCIKVEAFGSFAANTNSKQVRLYYGATKIADTGPVASASFTGWKLSAVVGTLGATQQRSFGIAHVVGVLPQILAALPAEDAFNSNIALTVKSISDIGTAADIVCTGFSVELKRVEFP